MNGRAFLKWAGTIVATAAVTATVCVTIFSQRDKSRAAGQYHFDDVVEVLRSKKSATNASLEDKFYEWVLTQEVDKIVKGLPDDRAKALALAKWVGTHWRNTSNFESVADTHNSSSWLDKAIWRTGACGTRTGIFVAMAEIAGLKVRRFSIYNFGHVGDGHTASQVYWGGQWHYFDVTYAGYFKKDGTILSFEQVLDLGDEALDYLVVFPSFGDVYGNSLDPSQWRRVDNHERMRRIYAPDNLAGAKSYGFVGKAKPVTLYFTMAPGDALGGVDGEYADVRHAERKQKKSEQLERMGFTSVPFFQQIELTGMKPGDDYLYEIDFGDSKLNGDMSFKASGIGCEITSGRRSDGTGDWDINLSPDAGDCVLSITHNIRDRGRFSDVDRIAFTHEG